MQEKERRESSFKIEQLVGELTLYSPLVALSYFAGTLLPCIVSMLCVFIFKNFFYHSLHLNKWYWCVTLSYSLFTVLSVFYKGLGITTPFLENQPMILVVICVGVAYLNCYAGIWQKKLTHKSIYSMTQAELYEHCRARGLDEADCEIAQFIVYHRLKGYNLYRVIGYSESQTKRIRKRILKTIK